MSEHERWNRLLGFAHVISTIAQKPQGQREAALAELESALLEIQEIFPRETDPIVDFEGYCVRRLSHAILQVVENLQIPVKSE